MQTIYTHSVFSRASVNVAQALMVYAQLYRLHGDPAWLQAGKTAWQRVYALHGQASGVFSGDECLAGRQPTRGTETCTVVETMMSLGEMWLASGDPWYADKLEMVAYNALTAAFFNGTMWSMNYFQQVNKLDAMDGQPHCEHGCTYCFGEVYECCVANHMQVRCGNYAAS